ncbi:MAG TPA: hypothetical protein VMV69_12815 [Pirellulales bacterium]|nr:hypothetical protein [Pirellulales bacterium]
MDKSHGNSDPAAHGRGIVRDIQRIQSGSTATADELRDFIRQFKGRSPQEVLGVVAQSGLTRAVATATIGCVVLMAIFTAGPYAWGKLFGDQPGSAAAAAKKSAQAAAAPAADAGKTADDTTATGGAATAADPAAGQELLDKLGEGESKTTDAGLNPLEESADDLLKDLK